MYNGCGYPYKSCLYTFWPCHPYFIRQFFQLFLYLFLFVFLIAFSVIHHWMPSYMVCSFNSMQCTLVARCQSLKFTCALKISSHAPMPRQADKEAALVVLILFLSWLTAEGLPEEWPLLEPSYSWSNQRSVRASLATSVLALALSLASASY